MVNRTVKVEIKADISDFNRKMLALSAGTKTLGKSIDDTNNQMGLLVGSALSLGPALIPIAATATPAITALASQLGFAALGAGVAASAFSGIGDALEAVNTNALNPTSENLANMQRALADLGPAGESFTLFLQDVRPKMQELQELTREGLLPGVQEGMSELLTMLPQVEQIVFNVATTMGDLAAQGGEALAGPEWEAFFNYLETEAQPMLTAFGQTFGNFTLGLANLFVAFAPASANFSSSFLEMSRSFADWTANLPETEGFQNFLDYLTQMGPMVWDMLTSIGNAIVALVKAAAPVGALVVPVLGALADVFTTIMETDAGPVIIGVVAAVNALSLAMRVGGLANLGVISEGLMMMTKGMRTGSRDIFGATAAMNQYSTAAGRASTSVAQAAIVQERYDKSVKGTAKAAGAIGILGFAISDLDEKMGLSNTAMGAAIGMMTGPWGAAAGAATGAALDLMAASDGVGDAMGRVNESLKLGPSAFDEQTKAIAAAQAELDKFSKSASEGTFGDLLPSGDTLRSIKNAWEGVFGSSDVEEAQRKVDDAIKTRDELARAADDAKFAEAGLGDAMKNASDDVREQTKAMLDNIAAYKARADEIAGVVNAEIDYERAVDAVTESVKENGRTNDIGTEKGRQNVESLYAQATAWAAIDPATQKAMGGTEAARAAFIKAARSMDYSKAEAELLAEALVSIPPNTEANVELTGERDVFASIKRIREYLASIRRNITVTVNTVLGQRINPGTIGGGTTLKEAHGGVVDYYANGGENHVAQIAPAGAWRVWAEPETGGEAYIPFAPEKRERSLDIWAETGRRLGVFGSENGGRPQRFADGGHTGTRSPSGPLSVSLVGARVGLDSEGFATFVDGRMELVSAGNDNYRASRERGTR